ncbi:MAG TPA: cyclic nucleotide-binding domain-containing protein [Acidimicrobiia bacterium]
MKNDPKIERLMTSETFAQLGEKRLRSLAPYVDEIEVRSGSMLMREGSFPFELEVIIEGSADIMIGDDKVGEVGPGAVLGEMALLERVARSATVVATSDTRLSVISARAFTGLMDRYPEIAEDIRAMAAARAEENARLME